MSGPCLRHCCLTTFSTAFDDWNMFEPYSEHVWDMSGNKIRCVGHVWDMFEACLGGVLECLGHSCECLGHVWDMSGTSK